jgi:hypothetical protein
MENIVIRHVSRWFLLLGWTTAMAIVWALFVPKGLSVGSFTLLSLTGPLALVCTAVLWRAQRPSTSVGQILADLEPVSTYRQMPK